MADPEPVGYLCTHGMFPETIRPGLQCLVGGDEPVFVGDTVHVLTEYVTEGDPQTTGLRTVVKHTAHVERGKR